MDPIHALIAKVEAYVPSDANEAQMVARAVAYLRRTSGSPFNRKNFDDGHITSSGWVIDHEGKRALLFLHKKLGKWMQPGGHMDDDTDVRLGALREVAEETGLIDVEADAEIFDIDVHVIPARGDEPEHFHYDIRILVRANPAAQIVLQESEGNDLRWVPFEEVPTLTQEESVLRMARKAALR